jgi:plasmid stabilization system protein ParE
MPRRLRLRNEADIDQLEIWVYTAEKFGIEQADRYKRR